MMKNIDVQEICESRMVSINSNHGITLGTFVVQLVARVNQPTILQKMNYG